MKKIVISILNVLSKVKMSLESFIFSYLHPIRVRKIKKRILNRIENKENIRVLFIVQFPEMWNSLKGIYKEMAEREGFDAKILAVPKRLQSNIFRTTFDSNNEAFVFLGKAGVPVINAYEDGKWISIGNEYDYIFLQRPYDPFMPKSLSMSKLSSKGLLCYIPYGFEFTTGKHLEIEYNTKAVDNLYLVYADNSDSFIHCQKAFKRYIKKKAVVIFDEGYPRFDFIKKANLEKKEEKVFLWLPRWSLDEANDRSGFFNYYDKFMSLFNSMDCKDWKLIIRPHPLMFTNFLERGFLTPEQYKAILHQIDDSNRVELDRNPDYLDAFERSDVLIADFTTLIVEYFVTGKPIIYCGDNAYFNSVAREMEQGLYKANTWELIEKCMRDVQSEDSLRTKRNLAISRVLCHKYPVSKHFVDLLEDISRNM